MAIDDLLTEIIGTKAKVAVLRTLIFTPGIAARKVQEKCGKSWGATKQTIDALLATKIITVKKGEWSDEIFINPNHCLYTPIKNLFEAEKISLRTIADTTFQYAKECGLDALSCYLLPEINTVYLVCKYVKSDVTSQQIQKFIYGQGLPNDFLIELTDSASFADIWHKLPLPNNFVLLHGESFPYRGVERALTFFEIEDNASSLNTSIGGDSK